MFFSLAYIFSMEDTAFLLLEKLMGGLLVILHILLLEHTGLMGESHLKLNS